MPRTLKRPQKTSNRRAPPARQDGLETRRQLLEAAGQVFAEQGYANATGKEICARAGANAAAVNYHFDGKEGLYAAVLEEAHHRIISLETMSAAAHSTVDPRAKLKLFLERIAAEVCKRDAEAWELRVLSREIVSRSPMMANLVRNQIAPKAKLVRAVIAEIMRVEPTDPAVSRIAINLIGPFLLLLITDRSLQREIAPQLAFEADALAHHMYTYALGGIEAIAKSRASSRKASKRKS
jgi:AcrR family transcriptional regulator